MNLLFSDRAEELVYHDSIVMPELSRKEHPDRVFGLRERRNFEEALSHPSASQPSRTLSSILETSPFKNAGEPLLFPFLILEAKSEKGSDDWDSIEKQTAFPIRTLLKLQQDLYEYTNEKSHWLDGPLVWFLSNKGEDWRVYGCFTDITDEILNYVRLTREYQNRLHYLHHSSADSNTAHCIIVERKHALKG